MMYYIYHTGLPKEQLEKIKNREYTHDEIEHLYQWIYRHYQAKQRAWMMAVMIVSVIIVVVGLLGLLKVSEKIMMIYLGAILVTTIMCVLICIYVKIKGRWSLRRSCSKPFGVKNISITTTR